MLKIFLKFGIIYNAKIHIFQRVNHTGGYQSAPRFVCLLYLCCNNTDFVCYIGCSIGRCRTRICFDPPTFAERSVQSPEVGRSPGNFNKRFDLILGIRSGLIRAFVGYQKRAKTLGKGIRQVSNDIHQAESDLASFQSLYEHERVAIPTRTEVCFNCVFWAW